MMGSYVFSISVQRVTNFGGVNGAMSGQLILIGVSGATGDEAGKTHSENCSNDADGCESSCEYGFFKSHFYLPMMTT
jgi:hypothetical protein